MNVRNNNSNKGTTGSNVQHHMINHDELISTSLDHHPYNWIMNRYCYCMIICITDIIIILFVISYTTKRSSTESDDQIQIQQLYYNDGNNNNNTMSSLSSSSNIILETINDIETKSTSITTTATTKTIRTTNPIVKTTTISDKRHKNNTNNNSSDSNNKAKHIMNHTSSNTHDDYNNHYDAGSNDDRDETSSSTTNDNHHSEDEIKNNIKNNNNTNNHSNREKGIARDNTTNSINVTTTATTKTKRIRNNNNTTTTTSTTTSKKMMKILYPDYDEDNIRTTQNNNMMKNDTNASSSLFLKSFFERFYIYMNEYEQYHYNNYNDNDDYYDDNSNVNMMYMIPQQSNHRYYPTDHDIIDAHDDDDLNMSYFWMNDNDDNLQQYDYHNITLRSQRFLSIEQRIQIYLLNWYLPPCHIYDPSTIRYQYYHVDNPIYETEGKEDIDMDDDDDNDDSIDEHDNDNDDNNNNNTNYNMVVSLYSNDYSNMPWIIHNHVQADLLFYVIPQFIRDVVNDTINNDDLLISYSTDVMNTIVPLMLTKDYNEEKRQNVTTLQPPVLVQYGDWNHCKEHDERKNINIPYFKKHRKAISLYNRQYFQQLIYNNNTSSSTTNCTSSSRLLSSSSPNMSSSTASEQYEQYEEQQAILWKLNSKRHYGLISDIDLYDTIPYEEKYDVAIYRGSLTGHDHTWYDNYTDYENCLHIQRCALVLQYNNSIYVDAKITKPFKSHHPINITHYDNTTNITTVYNYRGNKMSIQDMVQYKMIIMLEGNDVSSGLKWALYSNCIVLIPYPILYTSWSLEETLIPYVHFIPIYHNMTNLEEQIQYILNHPKEMAYINLRSTLFIYDLLYHPLSYHDDHIIYHNIYNIYQKHYYPI